MDFVSLSFQRALFPDKKNNMIAAMFKCGSPKRTLDIIE